MVLSIPGFWLRLKQERMCKHNLPHLYRHMNKVFARSSIRFLLWSQRLHVMPVGHSERLDEWSAGIQLLESHGLARFAWCLQPQHPQTSYGTCHCSPGLCLYLLAAKGRQLRAGQGIGSHALVKLVQVSGSAVQCVLVLLSPQRPDPASSRLLVDHPFPESACTCRDLCASSRPSQCAPGCCYPQATL